MRSDVATQGRKPTPEDAVATETVSKIRSAARTTAVGQKKFALAKNSSNVEPHRKKLRAELREFLDRCVIPALVEKFFAERQKGKGR